jgi:hypothetical protein
MKRERLLFRGDEVLTDPSQYASLEEFFSTPLVTKRSSYKRGEFIRGPVPIDWLKAAATTSPAAAYLGVILWHLARMRGEPLVIAHKILGRYGFQPRQALRLLRGLEAAQLITLELETGKAPRVRLVRGQSGAC